MSDKLKNICFDIIDKCVSEIKQKENMNKIKKEVLDPCVTYIMERLYPYILSTCIVFVLIVLMCIAILTILIFNKNISLKKL